MISSIGGIMGTLSGQGQISGQLSGAGSLIGELSVPEYIGGTEYSGEYTITPLANQNQVLETAGKMLTDDITVLKIHYYETSNTNGTTVYIAEV